jgi:cyclohexanecarboxylate-CoA ligase
LADTVTAQAEAMGQHSLLFGRDPGRPDDWLLWSYLTANADRHPGKTAVVHHAGRCSFGELLAAAEAMSSALNELGIRAGDTVSYQLPNWLEAMVVVLGALRLGAVANPIVPIYRQREVGFIVREAQTKVLFVPASYRGFDHVVMAREIDAPSLRAIVACGGAPSGILSYEAMLDGHWRRALDAPGPSPDDEAFLLYTSGTVANPKGVLHSQRTLLTDALSMVATTDVSEADVCFVASPVTHITGALYAHFLPQIHGNTLCLVDVWRPGDGAALIARERCTWTTGATPFLQGLVYDTEVQKHDISSLRVFRCGGADVPPKLIRDARAHGIQAFRSYGSSEHPTISGIAGDDPNKAATTDGRVHDHIDIRVVDLNSGRPVPAGQPGEIQTRGPELFLGYRDAALNRDAFTEDGWFRTGDLGILDAERFIRIVGRRKDIIIRKGENISAKEVEDVLMEHPALDRVAVIGLPDAERGEMVTAVCVTRPGAVFSFDDMTRHLASAGLARQKYPERLEFVDVLPMTASGKILKNKLRDQFSTQVS